MKKIAIAVILCIIALLAGLFLLRRTYQRALAAPTPWPADGITAFRVESGSSAANIAEALAARGLIKSSIAFKYFLRRKNWHIRLKPGLYRIRPGTDSRDIAKMIAKHDVWQISVTIPEGLTLPQIAQRIEAAGITNNGRQWLATADRFCSAATPQLLKQTTGIELPIQSAEGYLFPATYNFNAGCEPRDLATTMFREFQQRFAKPYSKQIRAHQLSLHELVTLASIVEREAAVDTERPIIARVFLNRLQADMKLESCATVQYALDEHRSRLLYSDLRVKSPYNTYIHKGLPPGPICCPGEKSLLAALKPAETDAMYFVSKGDGTHRFSDSLQMHERAVGEMRNRQ